MASSALYSGWSEGPYSFTPWGEQALAIFVDGVDVTNVIGTVTTSTDNLITVTGLTGTIGLGEESAEANADVGVSGVLGTTYLGTVSYAETWTGWGSGPWSRGAWGENVIIAAVTSVDATGYIGNVQTQSDNRFSVTGVVGTTVLGETSLIIPESVDVLGVVGTTQLGYTDVQETWTGWGSGPWSRGAWGEDVLIAAVTGVDAVTYLGNVQTQSSNNFNVTGVTGTTALGEATLIIPESVDVSGVTGTTQLGYVDVQETWTGWGSGPWGRGAWGEDVLIAVVTGVDAVGYVGTVSTTGIANISVTGVVGTTSLGEESVVGKAVVNVTGVLGTLQLGTASVAAGSVVSVSGVVGTTALGTATTNTTNRFNVTGVTGTTALGEVEIEGYAIIRPSGVQGTGIINTDVLIWSLINTSQDPNWVRIAA